MSSKLTNVALVQIISRDSTAARPFQRYGEEGCWESILFLSRHAVSRTHALVFMRTLLTGVTHPFFTALLKIAANGSFHSTHRSFA